jgi:hypothetical protein
LKAGRGHGDRRRRATPDRKHRRGEPDSRVTPAICASSTTASWVHPSAAPKPAYPRSSALTASRIVASASAWNGVTPTPTLEPASRRQPVVGVVSGEVIVELGQQRLGDESMARGHAVGQHRTVRESLSGSNRPVKRTESPMRAGVDHENPDQELRSEALCLAICAVGQLDAADSIGEAGIVLDRRARARLAAGSVELDDKGSLSFRSGVAVSVASPAPRTIRSKSA